MGYNIRKRLYHAIINAIRVVAHPDFDEGVFDDEELEEDEEESGHFEVDTLEEERGIFDRDSFSVPEGLRVSRPTWLYLTVSREGSEDKSWEIPLPTGSIMHLTAARKEEWLVGHRCQRFDEDMN